jgi:hypothetical protein
MSRPFRFPPGDLAFAAVQSCWVGYESRRGASGGADACPSAASLGETTEAFREAPVGAMVPVVVSLTNRSVRRLNSHGSSPACFLGGCARAAEIPSKLPPGGRL